MQKRRKLLSLSALVCALLLVFAFVFAGCGNEEQTGGTNSGGGLDENYTSVPTTETAPPPATLSLSAATATVAYGDTLTLTATVGNVVDGTVTWSVAAEGAEAITFEEGDATDAITADSATATLTLTGEAVTSTAYNVTATFVASDNAENTASASCAVTVVASNVTVNVTGTANALYTDGKETEKSTTLTATVSGTSGAVIAWSKTDEDNLVTLTNNGDGTATVAANSEVQATGTVTVTASVTYNDGTEEQTATGSASIVVTRRSLTDLAYIEFDSDLDSGNTNVTLDTTYSDASDKIASTTFTLGNTVQGTTTYDSSAGAFEVTHNTGNPGSCTAPGIEMVIEAGAGLAGDDETIAFSFWYNTTGGEDWNVIARVGNDSRITFGNLCSANGNMWPDGGGIRENGAAWDAISEAVDLRNTWTYITVTVNAETGIQFYKNAQLVFTYPVSNSNVATLVSEFIGVFRNGGTIVFFSNNESSGGVDYIDNLRITKNISAADLYSAANPTA